MAMEKELEKKTLAGILKDAKATGKIDYLGSGNTDTHLLWSCEWLDDWFVVADTQE